VIDGQVEQCFLDDEPLEYKSAQSAHPLLLPRLAKDQFLNKIYGLGSSRPWERNFYSIMEHMGLKSSTGIYGGLEGVGVFALTMISDEWLLHEGDLDKVRALPLTKSSFVNISFNINASAEKKGDLEWEDAFALIVLHESLVNEGDLHGVGALPLTVLHELLLHEPADGCVKMSSNETQDQMAGYHNHPTQRCYRL
jgi:hypothetical protein